MNDQVLIPDGHTVPFYVAGVTGVSKPISGIYRKEPNEQIARKLELIYKGGDKAQQELRSIHWLAQRIIEWDVTFDGKPVEPTAENIKWLKRSKYIRLFHICCTEMEESDLPPDTSDDSMDEAEHELLATELGMAQESAAAKN